jgi:mannose-1-phosphate guanylyltransferase
MPVIYGVIMAGGKGERFWPLSNESHPKQLLAITSDRHMLQVTLDRIAELVPIDRTLVVAGSNIKEAILSSCEGVGEANVLAEPIGRNTCLAIGCSAVHLQKKDPDAIMVVLSADHLIQPAGRLIKTIEVGTKVAAKEDKLITIGIPPSRAETGYGYIELGEELEKIDDVSIFNVSAFKEKPRPTVAQQYYYGGKHLWNSGMFIWSVRVILDALQQHMPEMHESLTEYADYIDTENEEKAREKLYNEAESIAIDIAVMEQADNVLTLKGDFVWDDVGSWLSLQRFREQDRGNNVISGPAIPVNTYECTIYNDGKGIIATMGVSDLVIVKTGDVVMVAHKTQLDQIKELLTKIGEDEDLKKYL